MQMTAESDQLFQKWTDIERSAEEVLTAKQEIVDLDRKRNSNREAIRALEKEAKTHYKGSDSKCWLVMGNSFFKLPNRNAVNLLKRDQQQLDLAVNTQRSELKEKVWKLREQEGKEELKGYGLKALSSEELSSVNEVIRANAKPTPMYYFK